MFLEKSKIIFDAFFSSFMKTQSVKMASNLLCMIYMLVVISHIFGCFWSHIGFWRMHEFNDGWIVKLTSDGIQEQDFWSVYVTSCYFVITTFSTIGYGDVIGKSNMENSFQLILIMFGISIFGFMIRTFQDMIHEHQEKTKDPKFDMQDEVNYWIMALNRAVDNKLKPDVIDCIQEFFNQKYKLDVMVV